MSSKNKLLEALRIVGMCFANLIFLYNNATARGNDAMYFVLKNKDGLSYK